MKSAQFRERRRDIAQDPSDLLAYFTLRQSMKELGFPLALHDGFVIVIVPAGFRAQPYKRAAYLVLDTEADEWGETRSKVRLATPPKRKGAIDLHQSIFDLQGLKLLIATHINEVPNGVHPV